MDGRLNPEKYQYFHGVKFTRDKKTGYYLNSTIRERMHRYVWKFYNGEIPDGYCVHHIDHDRGNNDISNLALMKLADHSSMHGNETAGKSYDKMIENLNVKARPKASEWHRSEAGRAWHVEQGKEVAAKMKDREYVSKHCGKTFYKKPLGENKFCSNACKSAWRRKSGVDNEQRTCAACGKMFIANKYAKTKTCSASCGSSFAYSNR